MSISMEQALTAQEFHYHHPKTGKVYRWRRNGKTKTWKTRPTEFRIPVKYGWKTRPTEFRIPVKYGLYDYGYIDHSNAYLFHVSEDCENIVR